MAIIGTSSAGSEEDVGHFWAAETDLRVFARRLRNRIEKFRQQLTDSGQEGRIRRMHAVVHGWGVTGDGDTSSLQPSGNQGELLNVTGNEVGTLVQQVMARLLNQRPTGKAIARNQDFSSLTQTQLAEGLLRYNETYGTWASYDEEQLFDALCYLQGWQIDSWDRTLGQVDGSDDDGNQTYEGDIRVDVCTPFDVAYDTLVQDLERLPWIAFRYRANRFNLAVRHKKCADELLKLNNSQLDASGTEWGGEEKWTLSTPKKGAHDNLSDEEVWVWECRILPCDALPQGRLVRLVNEEIVLHDSLTVDGQYTGQSDNQNDYAEGQPAEQVTEFGHYPYGTRLHASLLRINRMPRSLQGYSPAVDLLGLQDLKDNGWTAMGSAANLGAMSNLWVRSPVEPSALAGAGTIYEGPDKPERIEGIQVDPQVPVLDDRIGQAMQRRMGLNDLAMGQSHSQMPAQLAALLEAQATQYTNGARGGVERCFAETRTGRIYLYRDFAKTQRVALIAGATNAWMLREWTGNDLDGIERVTVEPVPAQMQTLSGRVQVAEMLINMKRPDGQPYIQTAEQLITLMSTGQDRPLYEGAEANMLRIQHEKELLLKGVGLPPVKLVPGPGGQMVPMVSPTGDPVFGEPPPNPDGSPGECIRPLITDTPWLDIPEYAAVIANPVARANPQVAMAVSHVITEKLRLWAKMPPVLQALLGCPPALITMMVPPPVPPPTSQEAHKPPPGGAEGGPSKPDVPKQDVSNLPQGSPPVKMPSPPPNPLNGAQAAPPVMGNQQ